MTTPTAYFRASLKHLLKAKGLSQKNFAGNTGTSKTYLNDVIKGRAPGKEATRIVWSKALGHTYEEMLDLGRWILLGKDGEEWPGINRGNMDMTVPKPKIDGEIKTTPPPERSNISIDSQPGTRHNIPLISWVQAGDWHDAEDPFEPGQAEEWLTTSATSTPNAFALTVRGDSMEPEFVENDIITIDPDRFPANGNFIIAKNGDEATFKQLVLDGSNVYLKPLNDRYPIKDMTGVDFKIIGVVVEKRKRYC